MFSVECWLLNVPKSVLIFAVRVYRLVISPAQAFLFGAGGGCRFTPTCSQFALDAVREHGAVAGGALAAKRICRCHPWGAAGVVDYFDTLGGGAGDRAAIERAFDAIAAQANRQAAEDQEAIALAAKLTPCDAKV